MNPPLPPPHPTPIRKKFLSKTKEDLLGENTDRIENQIPTNSLSKQLPLQTPLLFLLIFFLVVGLSILLPKNQLSKLFFSQTTIEDLDSSIKIEEQKAINIYLNFLILPTIFTSP